MGQQTSANTAYEELLAALDEFALMQQEHENLLASNRLKTLPQWSERRKMLFLRLRQCLDRFDPGLVDGASEIAARVRRAMEEIMRAEQALIAGGRAKREELKGKLQALRRGKTVLKGYSIHHGAGPKPRYLSSKA